MSRNRGFSLIELVLVISIIMVLSLVSGPIYRNHANKSRQTEGYALLGTIRSAQENYYGEYGYFYYPGSCPGGYSFTDNDPVLGIDARMNKFYKMFKSSTLVEKDPGVEDYVNRGTDHYLFQAEIKGIGRGAVDLIMIYNKTAGVEVFPRGEEANYMYLYNK